MSFSKKKLGNIPDYNNFSQIVKSLFSFSSVLRNVFIVLGVVLLLFIGTQAFNYAKVAVKNVSMYTAQFISSSIGEELDTDEMGQINVLVAGYGGQGHQGDYLTDTIMVASFNPKLGTVSFLSIPRDLYIKYDDGATGRINATFARAYHQSGSFEGAAATLIKKVTEITDVEINYYAMIDFQGFKNVVDKLGGITVDVPEDLYDSEYPTPDGGYQVLNVKKGVQEMDGELALKYARSRHSTSDFSRSYRQQLIIRSIFNKMVSTENLLNINRLKELYGEYNSNVTTNIGFKNILSLVKYVDKLQHFYSFVYSADCTYNDYSLVNPGCLLYYPPRASFGGASVILPRGADAASVSSYKYMQDFAFYVIYNQKFLLENAQIKILNGIDMKNIPRTYRGSRSFANDIAVELKRNGFQVADIGNAEAPEEKTRVYINGTGDYTDTVNLLKIFVSIDEVLTGNSAYGDNLTLVLGNDYLK